MLEIREVSFGYTDTNVVLNEINLTIDRGRHVALIGESGCGKSTLLQLIYGLYDLDKGQIYWKNQQVLGPKFHLVPGMEQMKYLAQNFDLMPHITVAENIGKYLSNFYPNRKQERVRELLALVEMDAYAAVKAKYLSGGQQQRVALARVLALEPELLLLDEPFSHIDNFRRNALRRNLFTYLRQQEITCIVATHDSVDALSFSDETIVMREGQIVGYGSSKDIYEYPPSKYIASLFGEVNDLCVSDFFTVKEEEDSELLLYPHQLMVSPQGKMKVEVKDIYFKGDGYLVKAFYNHKVVFFIHPVELKLGSRIRLAIKEYRI